MRNLSAKSRFSLWVWAAVLLILMSSWLYYWQVKTEPAARNSAVLVAKKQILVNANTFRQGWLLNGSPEVDVINGQQVHFTQKGWPYMLSDNALDCQAWLALLWPDGQVFGQSVSSIEKGTDVCHFSFGQDRHIQLQISEQEFLVTD